MKYRMLSRFSRVVPGQRKDEPTGRAHSLWGTARRTPPTLLSESRMSFLTLRPRTEAPSTRMAIAPRFLRDPTSTSNRHARYAISRTQGYYVTDQGASVGSDRKIPGRFEGGELG